MQRQCGRDIQYLVHACFRSLRHAPASVGRERFKVTARALGVQYAQRERGFARAGHARDAYDLAKRNVYVNIFEIVDLCSTDQNFIYHQLNSENSFQSEPYFSGGFYFTIARTELTGGNFRAVPGLTPAFLLKPTHSVLRVVQSALFFPYNKAIK